jgi:hypothetical protein
MCFISLCCCIFFYSAAKLSKNWLEQLENQKSQILRIICCGLLSGLTKSKKLRFFYCWRDMNWLLCGVLTRELTV